MTSSIWSVTDLKKGVTSVLRLKNPRVAVFERPSDVNQEILIRFVNRLRFNLDDIPASKLELWLESWLATNLRWC